ncbi:tRNA pseudouridine(55) synthase TruB [Selenomonas sp.]|uniref:tRNA pseudouridine(55) synthase TruB n=1 Tax=Selenomonas sp. TaxID=2053611 RepID=UPI0025FD5A45|nr:tRNA pseudouridine(55) synthase TruB [Selenomonas sp.]MCI6085142.1 tRNA pseudouridine(55) synthase TruB [Selenomonas sp.]MDY3297684.1 tRNA pseudouridine(55) synthase TruB [Selenomonas sp.]
MTATPEASAPATLCGFLNVLKPPGMSSHDIVGFVRHTFGVKKVGHAGTLDPGAAGVLPVAVGRTTRLIEYLEHASKSYRAELTLGIATDSGDTSGKVLERLDTFEMPSHVRVEEVLARFRGDIVQVPPAHSAIKIGGRRAYELVRAGRAVAIPERHVTIHTLTLAGFDAEKHRLLIDVACSRGTYIRTLCIDIGRALGLPAVMSFLVRTCVGAFTLGDAWTLEELAEAGAEALLPPETMLSGLARYDLPPARAASFVNGLSTHDFHIAQLPADAGIVRVYGAGSFLGIGRIDHAAATVTPEKVIANPQDFHNR